MARAQVVESLEVRGVLRPSLLGVVEEENVLVYELLEPADSGDGLARQGRFGRELAQRAGQTLASLHEAPLHKGRVCVPLDPGTLVLPPAEQLEALPLSWFAAASGAALQLWRLMQRDEAFRETAQALRRREREVLRVPAHCDVRLDQLLVVDGAVYLADWEEFRIADAARDVGAFLGEWMYHAVLAVHRADPGEERPADGAAEVVAELRRVQPLVASFWRGYRSVRAPDDPGLPRRAVSFAGWHLLDRLLAHVAGMANLRTTHHTVLGLARTALLSSGDLARLMELEPSDATRA